MLQSVGGSRFTCGSVRGSRGESATEEGRLAQQKYAGSFSRGDEAKQQSARVSFLDCGFPPSVTQHGTRKSNEASRSLPNPKQNAVAVLLLLSLTTTILLWSSTISTVTHTPNITASIMSEETKKASEAKTADAEPKPLVEAMEEDDEFEEFEPEHWAKGQTEPESQQWMDNWDDDMDDDFTKNLREELQKNAGNK